MAKTIIYEPLIEKGLKDDVRGCGVEFVATNGQAEGVQGRVILRAAGEDSWKTIFDLVSGRAVDENFIQEPVIKAYIIDKEEGKMQVLSAPDSKTFFDFQDNQSKAFPLIGRMLKQGFSIQYTTHRTKEAVILVDPSEQAYTEYDSCHTEFHAALRKRYREIHGETKCFDDPSRC